MLRNALLLPLTWSKVLWGGLGLFYSPRIACIIINGPF
jgi:hypothetical protein